MPQHSTEQADRRVKLWLLIVSVATLAALVAASLSENVLADWRVLRRSYRATASIKTATATSCATSTPTTTDTDRTPAQR